MSSSGSLTATPTTPTPPSALGNAPFVQVEVIINEIRKQVQPQLAQQEAPPT
jgi:hypothetical protein